MSDRTFQRTMLAFAAFSFLVVGALSLTVAGERAWLAWLFGVVLLWAGGWILGKLVMS